MVVVHPPRRGLGELNHVGAEQFRGDGGQDALLGAPDRDPGLGVGAGVGLRERLAAEVRIFGKPVGIQVLDVDLVVERAPLPHQETSPVDLGEPIQWIPAHQVHLLRGDDPPGPLRVGSARPSPGRAWR